MRNSRFGRGLSAIAALAMVSSCGGGGGGSASGTGGTPTPTPTPTPTAGCTLRERQDWAFAQLKEWYLFPDTLPASLDPTPYASVEDYIDALTATARSQHKDRYFTYLTSIAAEDAYYNSGSSAGFGIRLGLTSTNRLFVTEAFEGGAALNAGIDRGTEIVAIGTSSSNLRNVSDLIVGSDTSALSNALGPDTAGTSRVLRVMSLTGVTSTVTVTKTQFALDPVSSRYGAKIISDGGQQFGYINLRTFINPAEQPLKDAFLRFRTNGITNIIIDLRYNGGGLISVADLMGDLMGANRAPTDVWEYMTFRPEKSAENSNHTFTLMSQSIAPTKIAFIGGGGTASASELVINGMVPYLHANAGLIGSNTYGKPVGQIAIDKTACDDRFRVIAFAIQNAAHNGAYYDGLASFMEASCQASDDISYQLGDPNEQSTRRALDYLEGKSCTPVTASASTNTAGGPPHAARAQLPVTEQARELLTPDRPSTPQREVPGLF